MAEEVIARLRRRRGRGGAGGSAVSLRLPARPGSVGRARHAVTALAERAGANTERVALAVSEAVTNAILHAYRGFSSAEVREVSVEAALDGEWLRVSVSDAGDGMSPNPDTPGLGLGLPIIGQMAEAFEIESEPGGGTRVLMSFKRS